MHTKNEVHLWVTNLEPSEGGSIFDGIAFDDCYGLGFGEIAEHTGPVAVLSEAGGAVLDMTIRTVHISRRGVLWWSNINVEKLPHTPFFISSNLELNGPIKKKLKIIPTNKAAEIFKRDKNGSYPVSSGAVIGILEHTAKDDILIAFYPEGHSAELNSLNLEFSEWGERVGVAE